MKQARKPITFASEPQDRALDTVNLTAQEAARFLRYKNAAVLYKAIDAGLENASGEPIPVRHCGRRLLFDRAELTAWLRCERHGVATVATFPTARKGRTDAVTSHDEVTR